MSFLPHPPALSAPPTVGGHRHQVAASGSENSARPSVSMAPGPASVFPFPADARAFSARIPDLASALYGLPYTNPQSVYPGFASIDPAIFQSNLNRINHKEIPSHWRPQVPQSPLLQHCDPNLASLMYQGGYGSLALNDGGRRKNATRETTATLKAWLNEHRKNPYPTKGEKIMLAIVSKMTLTQVSTWFANARRRLKKENRMTWSPRNRCGDERMSDEEDFEADGPGKNISAGKPNIGCHSEMDSHMDEVNRDIPGHSHKLKSEEGELEEEADSVTNDKLPSNLSYTNIHTQLFLRHLASLPPHLRPSDPIKYFQQQIQQHAATNRRAVSVPDMPATTVGRAGAEQYREKVRQFSMDAHDNYKVFRKTVARCSSESSPNSSLNRSPSPQANRFFNRDPPALERGSSYRMHSNHEFSMHPVRNNPGRTPSYEKHAMPSIINESDDQAVQEKKKYKIWSPVNISELQSKSPILSNNSDSEINQRQVINSARRNSVFTYDESFMNDSRFSPETHKQGISASPAASSSSEKTTSGSPDNVGKNIIEEYQRQLAYRNLTAKTQHALAATLAGLAENRRNGFQRNAFPNPDALALLQQQQRAHHNFVLSDIFHSNAYKLSKEDRNPSANEEDEEAVFSDVESNAPINLTKSKSPTPRREERPTFKLDEEDQKRIIPSIVAN